MKRICSLPGLGEGGGSTPAGAYQVCGGREGVLHEGVGEEGPAAVGHVHRGHLHLLGGRSRNERGLENGGIGGDAGFLDGNHFFALRVMNHRPLVQRFKVMGQEMESRLRDINGRFFDRPCMAGGHQEGPTYENWYHGIWQTVWRGAGEGGEEGTRNDRRTRGGGRRRRGGCPCGRGGDCRRVAQGGAGKPDNETSG